MVFNKIDLKMTDNKGNLRDPFLLKKKTSYQWCQKPGLSFILEDGCIKWRGGVCIVAIDIRKTWDFKLS